MSDGTNVELLRGRLARAFEDPEALFEIVAPDVVWDLSDTDSPVAGVYHGLEEVRDLYRRWAGAFTDWSWEIERIVDAGDKVVVFVLERGRGRGSGVEVEMKRANVWTFREGSVVAFTSFSERASALEFAGIEAPDDA
jgi:hypothetical protein